MCFLNLIPSLQYFLNGIKKNRQKWLVKKSTFAWRKNHLITNSQSFSSKIVAPTSLPIYIEKYRKIVFAANPRQHAITSTK